MRIKKNIGFLLVILITLLRSENSRNDLFQILKNDNINHIQMTSGNIITIISGKFSPKRSDIDVRDIEIFCISIEKFLSQNSFTEDFIYQKTQSSISGSKHFRYQQLYNGIPVQGRFLDIHCNTHHQISSLSNDYQLIEDVNVVPRIIPKMALNLVKKKTDGILLKKANPELIIYTYKSAPILAYSIRLISRYDSKKIVVDASSGEVINIFSLIYFEGPILGSGENLLGEWVDSLYVYEGIDFPSITGGLSTENIYCEEYCWDYGDCDGQNYDDCVMSYQQGNCSDGYIEDCDGECFIESNLLWDLDDGTCDDPRIEIDMINISTGNVNMINTDNSDREPIFTLSNYGNYYTDIFYVNSETSVFDSNIGSTSHASGVSSHDYHTKTLEYFDSFGYLGMSGTGLRLANLIDYGPGSPWGLNNAFYNAGNQTLNYGMGSGEYRPWCAGLDVVAHEFAHSFTEHTSGLVYQDQPGALNEHMSDVFGYLVEAMYQDGGDWEMAEDITLNGNGIRNIQDPTIFGDPDHIESPYYFTGSSDFGGVHTNSSVPNKVLYLTINGDTHYGIEVEPFSEDAIVSREIAGNIWFNWNAYYLAEYDGFFIAAGKMLQTANDLYPSDSSIQQTVYDAWRSVGVDIFEPYLELNELTITEEIDGVINPGEDVYIEISLENITSNFAENVTGELSCPELPVTDGNIFFEGILPLSFSGDGDNLLAVQIPINIVISDKECVLNVSLQNQNDDVYDYEYQISVPVRLDQPGFPLLTNQILSSPALADLDGDGVDEIVITDNEGTVTVLNHSGEEQCTFDTGNQTWGSPAIADMDSDGELEIIVSSKSRHLYILDGDCTVEMDYDADQYLMGSPALGDIDGDGELEIIVGGYSSPGKLFAVNPDGTDVGGFPIELGEKIQRGVALADFNGNGRVDIVCGTDGENIYLIYDDGTVADGFPFEADNDFRSAPSVLEHNGEKIIFAGSRDDSFYALNSDGTLRFQVETGDDIITTAGFTELNSMPAVFFGSSDGFLYGVDVNGNALNGFPIETGGDVNSSPVFSVLDSETNETVVISGNEVGDVLAYTLDGEPVQYFPLSYEFPFKGAPTVKDTDGDGDLEILMGTSNSLVNVDVKTAGTSDDFWSMHRGNLYRTGYYVFTPSGGDMTVTVSNMSDWNLMGVPVMVGNNSQMNVYPTSIEGTLFSFEDSYVQESELNPGTGYWLRFEDSGETDITGSSINSLTIQMQNDWNLISGISTPVSYTDIVDPEGIVIPGTLFGFGESYEQVDELEPGKAYWLRTTDSGEIHLGSGRGSRVAEVPSPDNMNSITVRGMTLYFGVEVDETAKLQYSLPPRPPEGAFDVRFIGDTRICGDECEIEITGGGTESVLNFDVKDSYEWELINESDTGVSCSGTQIIELHSGMNRFTLKKTDSPIFPEVPTLYPAYPNPFNPVTKITYSLSEKSYINLSIYDMTGRLVKNLVSGSVEPGIHHFRWDGTNTGGGKVSSGIYLCKINDGSTASFIKLILMK